MTNSDPISTRRLRNQRISRTGFAAPEQVVDWLGAVQAQEYEPATWALALRMKGSPVRTDIETAFEEGRILRTHVMRPTWHFVTPGGDPLAARPHGPMRAAAHGRLQPPPRAGSADDDPCREDLRACTSRSAVPDADRAWRTAAAGGPRGDHHAAGASRDARGARGRHLQRTAPREAVHLWADRRACPRRAPVGARRSAGRAGAPISEKSRTGDGSRFRVVVRPRDRRCQARLRSLPRGERGGRRTDLLECGIVSRRCAARRHSAPVADLRRVSRRLSRSCRRAARALRDHERAPDRA